MKISSAHFSPLLVTFAWVGIISYYNVEASSFGLPTMTPEPTATIHSSDGNVLEKRDSVSATNTFSYATAAASSTPSMTDTIALHWASLGAMDEIARILLLSSGNSQADSVYGQYSSFTSSRNATLVGVSFLIDPSFSTSVSNLYMSLLSAAPTYQTAFQRSLTSLYSEFITIGSSAATAALNSSYSLSSQLSVNSEFVQYSICDAVFSDMNDYNPYQYVLLIQSSSDDASSTWLKDLVTAFSGFGNTNVDQSSVCNALNKAEFLARSYMMSFSNTSPYLMAGTSTILSYDTKVVTITDAGSSSAFVEYHPYLVSYTVTSRLVASYGIGVYTFVSTSWTHSVSELCGYSFDL
ncbi:unnamed protein product [Ambrosiozyma monospora]|uniref:Unnamed protein product n=1 Tax=Ambrosiozyma monospora TaxID=43982 RepID=A0ACB5TJE7_AMBMO|nr:unnamed protein product [Ambrosiozyma monospora]